MCGRFTFFTPGEIRDRFETSNEASNWGPSYNIAPGAITPVIIRNSPNQVMMMKWGFVPFWAKNTSIGYKMINARAEGIQDKPAFRKPIRGQRCLIPSNGYYEWKKINLEGKTERYPWFFGLKRKSLFSMAGIYDIWKDAEGKEIYTYSIITTTPNDLAAEIHDRMPVILEKDSENTWLDKTSDLKSIRNLFKPLSSDKMNIYPVTHLVNSPKNNSPELIIPVKNQELGGEQSSFLSDLV